MVVYTDRVKGRAYLPALSAVGYKKMWVTCGLPLRRRSPFILRVKGIDAVMLAPSTLLL